VRTWLRSRMWYAKARRYGVRAWLRRRSWERLAVATRPRLTRPVGPGAECEVHILTCGWDGQLAVWAVQSFYHFAGVDWPLVFHDGGGLTPAVVAALRRVFPDARVIDAVTADRLVADRLGADRYPATLAARRNHPNFKQAIDYALLADSPRVLGMDSDVLFFEPPAELVRLARTTDRFVYLRDLEDSYSVASADAEEWFGCALSPRVNIGLGVIPTALFDPEFVDRLLASGKLMESRGEFANQTVLALHAGRSGLIHLPDDYAMATGPLPAGATWPIVRHYAGPTRQLFFDEGLPYFTRVADVLAGGRNVS